MPYSTREKHAFFVFCSSRHILYAIMAASTWLAATNGSRTLREDILGPIGVPAMTPSRSTLHGITVAVFAGAALSLGTSALAWPQDMAPPIDAVGAYNHANVMARPRVSDGKQRARTPLLSPQPISQEEGGTISKSAFDVIVADLRSEYHRRVARDGTPAADVWLRRNVAELKQRYTRIED